MDIILNQNIKFLALAIVVISTTFIDTPLKVIPSLGFSESKAYSEVKERESNAIIFNLNKTIETDLNLLKSRYDLTIIGEENSAETLSGCGKVYTSFKNVMPHKAIKKKNDKNQEFWLVRPRLLCNTMRVRNKPVKYWTEKDWSKVPKSERKKYRKTDIDVYWNSIKLVQIGPFARQDPSTNTLTIRLNAEKVAGHTELSTKKHTVGLGIEISAEGNIFGTNVGVGGGFSLKGAYERVSTKGTSYSESIYNGRTYYTNECFTICCPVWAYVAKFQNYYLRNYVITGSQWVLYDRGFFYKDKFITVNPGSVLVRYDYDAYSPYKFSTLEPGSAFIRLGAELVTPEQGGCDFDKYKSDKICYEKMRAKYNTCELGGSFK